MENLYIVVLASGIGKRFGYEAPKQLIKINKKPLLYYSLKTATMLNPKEIILTFPPGYKKTYEKIIKRYGFTVKLTEGGERRQDSVINAVNNLDNNGIVLIHDSARPLASPSLFSKVYGASKKYGNAIPVIPIPDTVKEIDKNYVKKTLNRDYLFLSQTPQGFKISLLKKAFKKIDNKIDYTDEANLLELVGEKVYTVEGERYNLKLTFEEDLDIIKSLVRLYEGKGWFRC
ncbi:MAG: 2-C-methyl-D-erythritol 4-phosphate cytidylyltransferase [Proteobacteria bacterium]|nr:2-C-methyl-D-erythritol 4-phosphate cytidylyltransferase [Pseudomonadota bacterium]